MHAAAPGGKRKPNLDERVRERIKAYPGTLTFHDLIRKNKRDSFLLIVLMVALGVAIGAIIGGVVLPVGIGTFDAASAATSDYANLAEHDPMSDEFVQGSEDIVDRAKPTRILGADVSVLGDAAVYLPSLLLGAGVALLVGAGGALWSYFQGANAILRMVHAKEITPKLDQELFNVVDEMRIAAGLPMPKVYLIPESALNAFATGRNPENGVVAITTGLRAKLNRDELQGVIAHEMAHIRHFDIRFSLLMATMVGLIVMACDIFLRMTIYGGAGRRGRDSKGGGAQIILVVVAILLSILAPILARFIQMAYSRQREYLADAGAVELTRNPEGLASALRKLSHDEEPLVDMANRGTAHMYIMNPLRKMRKSHHSVKSRFSSHPPVEERIARLMALAR
jgi:heat shock protein HtpX